MDTTLDPTTAQLLHEQIEALTKRTGVSQPEATKDYCHCNDSDCERCQKQVAAATKAVAEAHARIYPEIADALEAASWGQPGPAVKRLMQKQGAAIAELTQSLADLRRMLAAATGHDHEEPKQG